jgi:hypothetical protein
MQKNDDAEDCAGCHFGRERLSVNMSLRMITQRESLEGCTEHTSACQEGRILCDSRSCSETYTSVLYCNFIRLVDGHYDT